MEAPFHKQNRVAVQLTLCSDSVTNYENNATGFCHRVSAGRSPESFELIMLTLKRAVASRKRAPMRLASKGAVLDGCITMWLSFMQIKGGVYPEPLTGYEVYLGLTFFLLTMYLIYPDVGPGRTTIHCPARFLRAACPHRQNGGLITHVFHEPQAQYHDSDVVPSFLHCRHVTTLRAQASCPAGGRMDMLPFTTSTVYDPPLQDMLR